MECVIKNCFAVVIFILGLYVYTTHQVHREGFAVPRSCPNLLIERDGRLHLYNTALAGVPGVNPITFDNLDEYTEFRKWQVSQGIRCPVLKLKQAYGAQGDVVYHGPPVYKAPGVPLLPSGTTLPRNASKRNPKPRGPAAFDPMGQDIGGDNAVDRMYQDQSQVSADAMQLNWGGAEFAQSKVDGGSYAGDRVYRIKGQ